MMIYQKAAQLLDKAMLQNSSLKMLALSDQSQIPDSMKKSVYAIVCSVLQYRSVLVEILQMAGLSKALEKKVLH
jgi:hypothetical protein